MVTSAHAAAARPSIRLNGTHAEDVSNRLLECLVEDRINAPSRLTLDIVNWGAVVGGHDFLYFDRQQLDFGRRLELTVGTEVLFDGRIVAMRANYPAGATPQVSVVAVDRLQDMAETRRSRSLTDLDDADVFRRVADSHGLQADVDLPGHPRRQLAQLDCSDLDFLCQRAVVNDARFWVQGQRLLVRRIDSSGTPLALAWGSSLQSFAVAADLRGQPVSVAVGGWSVADKSALAATAGPSVPDTPGGFTGTSLRGSLFGGPVAPMVTGWPADEGDAADLGRALMAARSRRFVQGTGRVQGADPNLRVGVRVMLSGLGPLHNGRYRVIAVRRRFNAQEGLVTEFDVQRNALANPPVSRKEPFLRKR